ncbi:hypothetical protein CUROG_06625 [Corynebacterium urogenitale]|uniref:Uncharacterized protein n=1 Tax=Corynebacterium urogenitale TaxID=2487892 RepID=A0A5J6Z8F8_9CORY|nr:hypothetical protein [Corynebacterium urogenitale]QFQ02681.1 hypothetical protein CUROG_06625 [Corynebacterium urogenitale]
MGEGQYVAEVAGPTENGEDTPATWFKVQAKEGHNTLISAATIAPITLGNDRQTVYFHTDLTATNATCKEEESSDFASFEYPEPSTGAMLSLNADKLKEDGCDPNEWRVGALRGGSRYEQPLPVEIMVGHEPIATGKQSAQEDSTLTVQLDGEEADGPAWRPSNEPGPEPTIAPMSSSKEAHSEGSENSEEQAAAGVDEENKDEDSKATGWKKWALYALGGLIAALALAVIAYYGFVFPRQKQRQEQANASRHQHFPQP